MATPRFAWGIDVGNRALKAVRVSPGPEGLVIDDFDVVEHEQVLSNAGDNKETLIASALTNFVQRHDLKGSTVAIGVSGQSSFARFIKLPPVEPKKIPEIVRFEAIQQIPFPLDEVEWSYQLFQDPNSPDVEVGIFAMRKELVNAHIKFFTDAGLNVQAVQMNPLAVYNAMYYDQRLKGTTMIVDLGAENTDLIIAEGEQIWLRSIPIGGNNFTETLVKAFKLKFPKAEELKRNAATSKYGRQILQAMKPVFNDLVAEIQRSIGFYASVHRDSRITRVLALGGTFRLPGLQKYVQQNLQIEVQRIDRLGAGAPSDARAGTALSENVLSSVSAYGLAIQAMGQSKINSSLLPMKIRREKLWQEKTRWFGAAAAVFVAAPLLAYGAIEWGRRGLDQTKPIEDQNARALTTYKGLDQQWSDQVESAGAPDRARTANYQSLLNGRDLQTTLISDITSALPRPPADLLTNDKTKLPPRSQRAIIRIDRISIDYKPDLAEVMAMNDDLFKNYAVHGIATGAKPMGNAPRLEVGGFTGRAGGRSPFAGGRGMPTPAPTGQQNAGSATASHGFVVEVVCTTPKADGASFVLNTFTANLKKLTSSNPRVSFDVPKVVQPFAMTLGSDPTFQSKQPQNPMLMQPDRTRGVRGGREDRRAQLEQQAQPAGPPPFDPTKDPATGEDMSNDTRVTVRMIVRLDPPKPQGNGSVAQATP